MSKIILQSNLLSSWSNLRFIVLKSIRAARCTHVLINNASKACSSVHTRVLHCKCELACQWGGQRTVIALYWVYCLAVTTVRFHFHFYMPTFLFFLSSWVTWLCLSQDITWFDHMTWSHDGHMILSHDNHMTMCYYYCMTHLYLIFPPESLSGVSLILRLLLFPP